jgi:putative membrane protein
VTVAGVLPYCGTPPWPGDLWSRWNLDPLLLASLTVAAYLYRVGAAKLARSLSNSAQAFFYTGWAIGTAALISPLCALSVSLFAARVAQHMVLALLAAPFVAAGKPVKVLSAALGLPARRWKARPGWAALLFAAALWFWHAPSPYAATFTSVTVYWSMHVTAFASAVWLWSTLLVNPRVDPLLSVLAGLVSSVQMGLLGALVTLAPRTLYAPHVLTSAVWGLTPSQDQQLGGSIMWVPGCVVFLGAAMVGLRRMLDRRRSGITGLATP